MANHAAKAAADIKAAVDDAYAAAIKVAKARNAAQRTGTPQININTSKAEEDKSDKKMLAKQRRWQADHLDISVGAGNH
jgi:hypothetical protein